MQNSNPLVAPGQNFNQSHLLMTQHMMQVPSNGEGVDDNQAAEAAESDVGMEPTPGGEILPPSLIDHLATMREKIRQLQVVVSESADLAANMFQGGGSGANVDMETTATNLANQMAVIDGGVSGIYANVAAQGLGVPPNSNAPNVGQSFRGGQVGADHGPSVATRMNSSMLVQNKNPYLRSNNRTGSGINSGERVPAMAGDMSHMNTNRSVNLGGMTASSVDNYVGDSCEDDDDVDAENLVPGSYNLVEMEVSEILAGHTQFCEICGNRMQAYNI